MNSRAVAITPEPPHSWPQGVSMQYSSSDMPISSNTGRSTCVNSRPLTRFMIMHSMVVAVVQ